MFPDIAKFSLANTIEDSNTVISNGNNTYILYFGIILLVIIFISIIDIYLILISILLSFNNFILLFNIII